MVNSPSPVMRNNYGILEFCESEEISQSPHMQLKIAQFRNCNLITPAVA